MTPDERRAFDDIADRLHAAERRQLLVWSVVGGLLVLVMLALFA